MAKNVSALDAIYDPANAQLLAFERARAAFLADLGTRWNGTLISYDATVSLIDLTLSGSAATGRIYETIRLRWIPHPV